MWDRQVSVTMDTKLRLWNLSCVSCWDLIKLYLCGHGGVPAFWILADLSLFFSTILSTNQPTTHPVPRSSGMQWNLLHCWGWRRREWGFGGRLVQTRDKRASDPPFLIWTMHHALCTMRVPHCWKSMHGALNAMYLLRHWCKASKLCTYVQRKQRFGGLRHFFLFHPADCKNQLFLLKYQTIKYFWGWGGNKWKHLLKLELENNNGQLIVLWDLLKMCSS